MEMAREAGMIGLESSELLENFETFAALVREDALAQPAPVQEPMAIHQVYLDGGWVDRDVSEMWGCEFYKTRVVYTTPPTAQPAPVQEPVAWLKRHELADLRTCNHRRLGADSPNIWAPNAPDAPPPELDLVAVYTTPPAQPAPVPLTDEQREDILDEMYNTHGFVGEDVHEMVDYVINATEAHHGITEKGGAA
jgi:hypothetical protein